jgi:hypothetical protein
MEHPVVHFARATKLLNHLIQKPTECFFVGFPCLPIIPRILVCLWPLPVTAIPVVILPVGHATPREPVRGPPRFEEHPDP